MSEEALWYAARVAGLMTWILAFGSLSAGLLVRSRTEDPTPATRWAVDTHRFLGVCSFLALLVHGSAVVIGDRSDITVTAALSGYQHGSRLSVALLIGVICGWMLVLVEVGRAVLRPQRQRSAKAFNLLEPATTLFAFVVVGGGAYHAWIVGSDTRNVVTLIVAGLAASVLVATAALGALTIFSGGEQPPTAGADNPDRLGIGVGGRSEQQRSLGSWSVSTGAASSGGESSTGGAGRSEPDRFDPQLSVSLSRQVDQPAAPQPPRKRQVSNARDTPADGEDTSGTAPPPQHRRS